MSTVQSIPGGAAPAATPGGGGGGGASYVEVAASPEFRELRARFRRFVFPMTVLFLAWYFTYVLLAAYAPGFMGIGIVGDINVGLVLGLGQFLSTFVITWLYVRWADRKFDTSAAELRARIEGPAPAEAGGESR